MTTTGERVALTWHEVRFASEVGMLRRIRAMSHGRRSRDGDGLPPDKPILQAWGYDINGAVGECAFAKARNVYWPAAIDPDHFARDVDGYQVRATALEAGGLPLKPSDDPTHRYVLVVGHERGWRIVGTLKPGFDYQRPEFWRDDWWQPAWCVPQELLEPWPAAAAAAA